MIRLEDLDVKDTANDVDEWAINENLEFASDIATNFVPSTTSTDVDSFSDFKTLATMHLPNRSTITLQSSIDNADGEVFKVPTYWFDQKPILSEEFNHV